MALSKKEIAHFAEQMPEGFKIVDGTDWLPEKEDEYAAWRFVEEFYPNYYSCDDIAYNNDLGMIVNGTWEDSESATRLLKELETEAAYANYYDPKEYIKDRLAVSDSVIYKKAIEGFIAYMKGGSNG